MDFGFQNGHERIYATGALHKYLVEKTNQEHSCQAAIQGNDQKRTAEGRLYETKCRMSKAHLCTNLLVIS